MPKRGAIMLLTRIMADSRSVSPRQSASAALHQEIIYGRSKKPQQHRIVVADSGAGFCEWRKCSNSGVFSEKN